MITWIGLCAGEIWNCLDMHDGKAEFHILFSKINAPKETILMAMGWLAREGHIIIDGSFPSGAIKLRVV
ncbi:MAG TPA: winged helix-turn-helix domain-containing protein [Candidatus Omnitrophota bacterium]|nr:winged helix-turn-helix domain-containing protein [Candidatus Omnitrophota bacterium]